VKSGDYLSWTGTLNGMQSSEPIQFDSEAVELDTEQRAAMKARLRAVLGEPPQEMIDLARERENVFQTTRLPAAS